MMAFRYYYPAIDLSTVHSLYRSDKDVKKKIPKKLGLGKEYHISFK